MDTQFPLVGGSRRAASCFSRILPLPYRAHSAAESSAFESAQPVRPTAGVVRRGVMFHGAETNGAGRPRGARALLAQLSEAPALQGVPVRIQLASMVGMATATSSDASARPPAHAPGSQPAAPVAGRRQRESNTVVHASVRAMRMSAICLVPEGDTISSRRLFDALATGCVPLLLRSRTDRFLQDLPFARSVAWGAEMHGHGVRRRSKLLLLSKWPQSLNLTATWLRDLLSDGVVLGAMGRTAQHAFRAHLAYDANATGVAQAFVAEVAALATDALPSTAGASQTNSHASWAASPPLLPTGFFPPPLPNPRAPKLPPHPTLSDGPGPSALPRPPLSTASANWRDLASLDARSVVSVALSVGFATLLLEILLRHIGIRCAHSEGEGR